MRIAPQPGLQLDATPVSAGPVWLTGINIRFRLEQAETIGLFGPLKTPGGTPIQLPGSDAYRKVFTTPDTTTGQILFGSVSTVQLVDYDPNSTPVTGTRWRQTSITPTALSAAVDAVPNPSAARVEIPPVWWFADQDDLVVGSRANVADEPVYAWDRQRGTPMAPIANSPTGAVGGGIINRILILLGCTSFTDPEPARFMTIRWSDRFNFEDWTPSDVNVSGELQLEGGSRIVGGGVTGFGVAAWTDKRFAILTETFDPNSVFERRYVDGGRGLIANNAWCEADGRLWWYDEHRVLNRFDGGRPVQIPNPLKYGTIERLNDVQTARAYMVPNPEYGEVILHYPTENNDIPDRQLVYNYILDAWYVWGLPRTGWHQRVGLIRNIAVDPDGFVKQHDLDPSLPDRYIIGPGNPNPDRNVVQPLTVPNMVAPTAVPVAEDVDPFDFVLMTNLVTMEDVTSQVWRATRVLTDHLHSPAIGAEDDVIDIVVTGYGQGQTLSVVEQDWQTISQGQNARDFRVGGKALQIGMYGYDQRTVWRFGGFDVTAQPGGER